MRLLIDGYNLMHATGRMRRQFGPDGLRRARHRFLNELAHAIGQQQAVQTTIVFDARSLPLSQPPESSFKGMTVIYAIEDDDADTRIELLIASDSAPKSLTVVSTDRRIRKAAQRRRASSMLSDQFLDYLDSLRHQSSRCSAPKLAEEEQRRVEAVEPEDTDEWLRIFGELDEHSEVVETGSPVPSGWTDEEFHRISREVDAEFLDNVRPLSSRSRRG